MPPRNDIHDPVFIGFALNLHTFTAQIINSSALFFFRWISSIKNNTVPTFNWSFNLAHNPVAKHLLYTSYINTAALWKSSLYELLVVRTLQKSVRKPAREALLQFTNFFLRWTCIVSIKIPINRLAIFTHHVSYIFRTLQSSFYFKRSYPCLNQLRHNIDRRQILRREQIRNVPHRFLHTIHHQIIRQTTGLSALTTIC
ncbi:hypothetical protein D3C73_794040 [compost metagenome]